MSFVLSHHIISPLGADEACLEAVAEGRSALRRWQGLWSLPHDFTASLLADRPREDGLTAFESMAVASARAAIRDAAIDPAAPRTLLVVATTKGDIDGLGRAGTDDRHVLPGHSAETIARRLGIATTPVVVDNACVSGLSALLLADRLLAAGHYDHAVVCGVELQGRFIVSGFQSLKALSAEPCRPFDIGRNGLNLGEGAATVVLGRERRGDRPWRLVAGAMRNDAYHISAPSRSAEGARRALTATIGGRPTDDIACINAHGTATLFNDQMESVAIERSGLGHVPVNALKGNLGHTMGACGVMETVLTMMAVGRGVILPTKGFGELGVSGKIVVNTAPRPTRKGSFVKMLSGFGGGNAAVLMSRDDGMRPRQGQPCEAIATHHVRLTPTGAEADGRRVSATATGRQLVTELYRRLVGDYPRFFKMDLFCRVGFIATELLLRAENQPRTAGRDDRAVVVASRSGSLVADKLYLETIARADDYFPSPERFVYTLPNIVTGEICIRNQWHGETLCCLLPHKDEGMVRRIVDTVFCDPATQSAVAGWVDCMADDDFEADLWLVERPSAQGRHT